MRDWRLGIASVILSETKDLRSETGDWRLQIRDWLRLSAVFGLLSAFILLSACTATSMRDQPRIDPLEDSDVFEYDQSARPALQGVVSRQDAAVLDVVQTGRQDGELVDEIPFEVTDELLARGAEQFQIYCTPCHDSAGTGAGTVVQRGFPAPPSFYEQRLRDVPDGYIFDVITNGFGVMYSYAPQVEPVDRWAIVAHIRRLQEGRQPQE